MSLKTKNTEQSAFTETEQRREKECSNSLQERNNTLTKTELTMTFFWRTSAAQTASEAVWQVGWVHHEGSFVLNAPYVTLLLVR
jgi:hypothetical protein